MISPDKASSLERDDGTQSDESNNDLSTLTDHHSLRHALIRGDVFRCAKIYYGEVIVHRAKEYGIRKEDRGPIIATSMDSIISAIHRERDFSHTFELCAQIFEVPIVDNGLWMRQARIAYEKEKELTLIYEDKARFASLAKRSICDLVRKRIKRLFNSNFQRTYYVQKPKAQVGRPAEKIIIIPKGKDPAIMSPLTFYVAQWIPSESKSEDLAVLKNAVKAAIDRGVDIESLVGMISKVKTHGILFKKHMASYL
jgi:hypothetical protein